MERPHLYSGFAKSNYVLTGRHFQNASLRIVMVPAYGGEYFSEFPSQPFVTVVIACNGNCRLGSMQHCFYIPTMHLGGRLYV